MVQSNFYSIDITVKVTKNLYKKNILYTFLVKYKKKM